MASFDDHLHQAKENLKFIQDLSASFADYSDWKTTACFYVAVHLINAHIAKASQMHYRSHHDVGNAINPYNQLSPSKLSPDVYACYDKLSQLSRRARYLVNDSYKSAGNEGGKSFLTHEGHFVKSMKYLDVVMSFMNSRYDVKFNPVSVKIYQATSKPNLVHFRCS